MAEPTLQEVFGAGATQTATTITILKADLDLTASVTNRAEQLLAGIAKKAAITLTGENFSSNGDQSITISSGFDSLVYRTIATTQQTLLQTQLTFNFAKLQPTSGISPNDY
jgi:hypothetical protein